MTRRARPRGRWYDRGVPRLRLAAPLLAIVALAWPALSAGAQPPTRPVSARAARLIEIGQGFVDAGDRGSAIGYFRDAIAADPLAAAAYEGLGDIYRQRGALNEARRVYELGLTRLPGAAPLWLGLARTLDEAGSRDDAARAIRSLLERDPRNAEAIALRADLARRRGAWSEALTAYRTLLAIDDATLDEERVAEARRYEAALRLLARPLDPVSAPRACAEGASAVRRALARCE